MCTEDILTFLAHYCIKCRIFSALYDIIRVYTSVRFVTENGFLLIYRISIYTDEIRSTP